MKEVLRKNASRKQKFVTGGVILLVLLEIIFIYLALVSYSNKNLDKYIMGVNTKINKMLAIMLEDENGDYKTYNSETFPEFPYIFNKELSKCIDIKGNIIEDNISFDEDTNLANIVVTKTSKCYFYFNRPKEVERTLTNKLLASGELWQSGLEGDGYRYVGSGNYDSHTTPNNFICFGTNDKTECKNNEAKYMYRIIGVFEGSDGEQHLKLISFKQLGVYTWHSYNSDTDWAESDLYVGLNGSYFFTNASYDYLQNSSWLNKIENWQWTAVNTLSFENGGPNYNAISAEEMYLHEMNRSSKSSSIGEWSTPVAKIGLMYASDYMMSLGNNSLKYTSKVNTSDLKTGWIHQSNNDTTKNTTEWTLTRFGFLGNYFSAWNVSDGGAIGYPSVFANYGIRPVMFLTSDVERLSGNGSYNEPYLISDVKMKKLSVTASLSGSAISLTITKGDYDLNKYCINRSKNSYENCTWKKIVNTNITDELESFGDYYVHVTDKDGYIAHSDLISYKDIFSEKLINSGELWQSGLEGDGYRYVGSGAYNSSTTPSNFICFGTTDKTECKNNESKYMFRIIGIFDGYTKLIKFASLEKNAPFSGGTRCGQGLCNFPEGTLYESLNGNTSNETYFPNLFFGNSNYSYLNDGWSNLIAENIKSSVQTLTKDGGPNYYNSLSPSNIFLHEKNRDSKTNTTGKWVDYTGKIGVMEVSDYLLSLGSNALSLTTGTYSNRNTLKTSWLFLGNNIYGNTSGNYKLEQTSGSYGNYSSTNFYSWIIHSSGYINYVSVSNEYAVRPVFYLNDDVEYKSGSGTYMDPYIINY